MTSSLLGTSWWLQATQGKLECGMLSRSTGRCVRMCVSEWEREILHVLFSLLERVKIKFMELQWMFKEHLDGCVPEFSPNSIISFFLCACLRFKMWFLLPVVTQLDPSYFWAATMAPSTTLVSITGYWVTGRECLCLCHCFSVLRLWWFYSVRTGSNSVFCRHAEISPQNER